MQIKPTVPSVCRQCGADFVGRVGREVAYCTRECYFQFKHEHVLTRSERRVRNWPTRSCQQCSKPFLVNPGNVQKGRGKYCSPSCYHANIVPKRTTAERFWAKVEKTPTCWVWTGSKLSAGPGKNHGRMGGVIHEVYGVQLAHRVSWVIHFGPIPDGMAVCHRCDNPPCIRPDHLFLGTIADNNRDMFCKGRGKGSFKPGGIGRVTNAAHQSSAPILGG